MSPQEFNFEKFPKKLLSNIFNSLSEGLILVDLNNKIIFLNSYLKDFLQIYNTEDISLSEVLKITKKDQIVDLNLVCPPGEVVKNGIVFTDKALFIETFKGETKLIKINTYKYQEFYENGISCLITISDDTKAQELEKMKIDFSSQSVHVLRTPVSIIRNNIDFLKRENFQSKLDDKEKEFIKGLSNGADRLQNIVETMISLNDIQNEKIKLLISSTNLVSLAREAVKELSNEAINKNLHLLVVEPIYEIPNVRADSLKILDVLKAIIKNAIKFTSEGTITISFEKNINEIIIKITDTGKGIPEIGLKNLFNKFYHYKTSALNMEEGLGIGLYICKKIMEEHGGNIEVKSKEKSGTQVMIKFPNSLIEK